MQHALAAIYRFETSIAVVAHDAGAANVVISALLKTGRVDWRAHMQGPAEKLWKLAFPEIPLCGTQENAILGADLLITGTGWETDIEHNARKLAQSYRVKSITVIDHWVNYKERFVRDGELVLPDEFWVTDEYAMEIALFTFPGRPILQIPNYYMEKQLRDIAQVKGSNRSELLYVLEPLRTNWERGIPGEFQALDYFISCLPELHLPTDVVIRLRPHPSEPNGKYSYWINQNPHINIELDTSICIAESLGRAKWVAGCESFALVLALYAGRTVYCTLPPWAPICRLPHSGLIQLRELSK
jgi:hypothetical protein